MRRLMRLPVLGLAQVEAFRQGDGVGSQLDVRLAPFTLSLLWRTRSRAWRSLETRRAFSHSAKAPAIWRIIFRVGSSLAVRSSPEAAVGTPQEREVHAAVAAIIDRMQAGRHLMPN